GDQRYGVLAVVVERDLADDGIVVFHLVQRAHHLLAIRPDGLDGVEDEIHRREGEGAVGFRTLAVALLRVLLKEELAARQLLRRRALAERDHAFGQRADALDERVRHDAGGALELRLQPEPLHLYPYAHPERRQAAE